jgi:Ca2+-binding EF-hand superfamily protein
VIKDSDGEKLTKLLDVFDSYDLDMDGFLDTAEVAALATDLGLDATFLDAYINCQFQNNLIDEDELIKKAVCVGGKYS